MRKSIERSAQKRTNKKDPLLWYKRACSRSFAYLVSEMGFRRTAYRTRIPECSVEYRNDLGGVAVIVSYEYLSVPWVVVAPLDPISKKGQYGKGIPFHDYVAVRFPELAAALDRPPNGWTDSDIKRVLSEDAMTLKQFGRDLLEGDFDSLGDIRAHQKRRFERERRAFRRGILKQGDKPTAKHPSRQ